MSIEQKKSIEESGMFGFEAKVALHEAEEKFRLITNTLPFLIAFVDKDLRYRFVNKTYEEWYGIDPSRIIGRQVAEILGKDAIEVLRPYLDAALTGHPVSFEATLPIEGVGICHVRSKYIPRFDETGTVDGFYGLVEDITRQREVELALRESEARYQSIYHSEEIGVIFSHADGCIADANDAFLNMIGYSREDLLAGNVRWDKMTPPEFQQLDEEKILELKARGTASACEKQYFHKDGHRVDVWVGGVSLISGSPDTVVACVLDITERKQFERALTESEERFKSLADASSIMIGHSDALGNPIYYNKAWLDFVGADLDEMLANGWEHYLHPDDQENCIAQYQVLSGDKTPVEVEYRLRRKDGNYRWMYSVSLPRFDRNGELMGYVGSNIDIHDRKETEQVLRESETRYRLVVEATNDGIWDTNLRGTVAYNDRFFEILGLPRIEDFRPNWYEDLLHPDDVPVIREKLAAHYERNEPYQAEFRVKHSSGEYRYCLGRGKALRDATGKPVRMVGTMTDITEAKEAELALQKALRWEQLNRRIAEINSQNLEMGAVLELVAKEIGEFFKTDRMAIGLYKQVEDEFHVQNSTFYCAEGIPFPTQEGIPSNVIQAILQTTAEEALKTVQAASPQEYLDYLNTRLRRKNIDEKDIEEFSRTFLQMKKDKLNLRSFLRIGIAYKGIPYGFLMLEQCTHSRSWEESEIAQLKSISLQVGNALYQAELYRQERQAKEALQRGFERERVARQVIEIISQPQDIDTIMQTVTETLACFLDVDRGNITRFVPKGQGTDLVIATQYCRDESMPLATQEDLATINRAIQLFTPDALAEGEDPVTAIPNMDAYKDYFMKRLEELQLPDLDVSELVRLGEKFQTKAMLRANILYRNKFYGSVSFNQTTAQRDWTDEEVELVKTVAENLGSALYQAELHEEEQSAREALQRTLDRERLIRKTVEIIGQSRDIDLILKTVADEVGQYLQADRTSISRYYVEDGELNLCASAQYAKPGIRPLDQEDVELIIQAVKHLSPEAMNVGTEQVTNIADQDQYVAFMRKQLELLGDLPGLPPEKLIDMVYKYGIRSSLRVNIFYRGVPYGSISVSQIQSREWQPDEIELIKTIADHAGSAIYQAELYRQEQKAREEAEGANRNKSDFLAKMSHELRTPLNAVIGYSDMMKKGIAGPLNEKQERYTRNISTSGKHLLAMVNDILDISKVEAGKMTLGIESVDIQSCVTELRATLDKLAREKSVHLWFEVDPRLQQINADPVRLRQIFFNLMSNAIKFNRPNGNVFIRLYYSADHDFVIGQVQDTGIGIPAEKLPELFQEFHQLETLSSRVNEGTGLGLALTRHLVKLHGGTIDVSSVEGEGTTFTIKLPVYPVQPLD